MEAHWNVRAMVTRQQNQPAVRDAGCDGWRGRRQWAWRWQCEKQPRLQINQPHELGQGDVQKPGASALPTAWMAWAPSLCARHCVWTGRCDLLLGRLEASAGVTSGLFEIHHSRNSNPAFRLCHSSLGAVLRNAMYCHILLAGEPWS